MRNRILLFVLFFSVCNAFQVEAQLHSKVENFTLTNLVDEKELSLSAYNQYACVVLVFTSAYCPYTKTYKDRLLELVKKYDTKVQFILINPENHQDTEEMMKEAALEFNLPYLLDKKQLITTKFNAHKTPEVYVLQQSLGHFVVRYHGAIDDNPQLAEEVTKKYLEDAIKAVLEKKSLDVVSHKPTGCMIKK